MALQAGVGTVAFIGLEGLGGEVANHLIDKGYTVKVTDVDTAWAAPVVAHGGLWFDTIAETIAGAQVIFTYLDSPETVEEIYMGSNGIFENIEAGTYLVDFSTSSPSLAAEIYQLAAVNGAKSVDAPFLGCFDGYDPNELILLIGAADGVITELQPILSLISSHGVKMGIPGQGQAAKLANLIALAASLAGTVEALAFSTAAGLDPIATLGTIVAGPSGNWVSAKYGRAIADENFDTGIMVARLLMELSVVVDTADELDVALPVLENICQLIDLLAMVGGADKGAHALYLMYSDEARCAQHGLDWSIAERMFAEDHCGCGCGCEDCDDEAGDDCDCGCGGHEHGHGCGHDHDHGHNYDQPALDIYDDEDDEWVTQEWDPAEWGSESWDSDNLDGNK